MKLFLKLFATAFLSALLLGVCIGIFIVIENYYEISTFDNFVGGFTMGSLISFLFYVTVVILFSYLNIWITNKVNPKNTYVFGLLMYSFVGVIVGVILFPPGLFYIVHILQLLGQGILATNIFYHVLFLINVLAKRKNL